MLNKFKKELKDNGKVYLRMKVLPQASQTKIQEVLAENTIKISLKATPRKGQANQELVRFLSKEFAVAKENIKIISGAGARIKLIKIC